MMKKGLFGKQISIEAGETIANLDPLPKSVVQSAIIGQAGSGKSYALLSLIPQFHQLVEIVILTKLIGTPVHKGIEKYAIANEIRFSIAHDIADAEIAVQTMIDRKNDREQALIILDDFSAANPSRSDAHVRFASLIFMMLRNYSVSCIFITQSIINVPTLIRANLNHMMLFAIRSSSAIRIALTDFENISGIDSDRLRALYKRVLSQRSRHGFIMTNPMRVWVHLPDDYGENSLMVVNDNAP